MLSFGTLAIVVTALLGTIWWVARQDDRNS
jgi:hypothetical protein